MHHCTLLCLLLTLLFASLFLTWKLLVKQQLSVDDNGDTDKEYRKIPGIKITSGDAK